MTTKTVRIALAVALGLLPLAKPTHAQQSGRGSTPSVTIATWNIQTLATPGRRVFPDSYARTPGDYAELSLYRERVGADVFALEEISSPAALALVFPQAEYVLCLSGQYEADLNGLDPEYRGEAMQAIKPACFDDPNATLPDAPPNAALHQYVAFAIRRGSGVGRVGIRDVRELGVVDVQDQRPIRWGLELEAEFGGRRLTLLGVHLKSGCFEGAITPTSHRGSCRTLAEQLAPLKGWVEATRRQGKDFIILGDFNRRLDIERPDVLSSDLWDVLNGQATPDPSDDVALKRDPFRYQKACWPDDPDEMHRWSIDFFVLSPGAWQLRQPGSFQKLRFTDLADPDVELTQETDERRLSDHCPMRLTFKGHEGRR